jgi:ribosomal protein S18 acetylase RimI-like enzyme
MSILSIHDVEDAELKTFQMNEEDIQDINFVEKLQKRLKNESKKLVNSTYVHHDSGVIKGYISICSSQLKRDKVGRGFGTFPYNTIPSVLIALIAVHKDYQRQKIGTELMDFTLEMIIEFADKIGIRFIVVDALNNDKTLSFYRDLGFIPISEDEGSTQKMIKDIKPLFEIELLSDD